MAVEPRNSESIDIPFREGILCLARQHGVRQVSLFGSAARDQATEFSDIDLLVQMEEGRTLFDLIAFKLDAEALLGREVDVVSRDGLSPYLAEYILAEGNPNVILCERGIRTFETYTRNTLDLSIVPSVKEVSHLPIIVDPSHGTGRLSIIEPMSLAAMAAGADGILIEVHCNPAEAMCDKDQAMPPEMFTGLMKKLRGLRSYMHAQN